MKQVRKIYDRAFKEKAVQLSYIDITSQNWPEN
jgi:hypothetical protein